MTTTLHPVDLALLRYAVPALVMAPVILRTGLLPKGVHRGWLALTVIGAGTPFGLLAMGGSAFAPVAHMGVIIPGGMALGVAFLSWRLNGERFARSRLIGLAFLSCAIALIGASSFGTLSTSAWMGDAMFLAAAMLWSGYTIAFRKTGLTPIEGTALIAAWSAFLVLPLWFGAGGARLMQAPIADIALQLVWQSILAGVVAVWAYGKAVQSIGPANTAAIGALLPAASSLGGLLILGEPVSAGAIFAVGLAIVGVLLATGYLDRLRHSLTRGVAS